jgi:hypothetical protein
MGNERFRTSHSLLLTKRGPGYSENLWTMN